MEENLVYTNYNEYNMKFLERVMYILFAAVVIFAIVYIFYRSILMSIILTPLSLLYPKYKTKQIISARKMQLSLQFKDMLYSLSSAIGAGNSVERALAIVKSDMERQYFNSDTFIVKELEIMVRRLELNQNIEDIFNDFAQRSGLDDIKTFANIFDISKRTGGNLIQIIRSTSTIITEKIDTKLEIDTMLSGKKMEQKVLTIIPIAMVLFLTETTEGFMDVIFTTLAGRITATIALIIIAIGYFWSKKITDIQI